MYSGVGLGWLMSKSRKSDFPSFFDWCVEQNATLAPCQWEVVKVLSEATNASVALSVTRNGGTLLNELWWKYHTEKAHGTFKD